MHAVKGFTIDLVINENRLRKDYFQCEEGDLETQNLTVVAKHVVEHQFVVKPEPLVRLRREPDGAHNFGQRRRNYGQTS